MNIKEKIGQRIEEERKLLGLTLKSLAELTDDLKPSRIHNWERGTRTPGPDEIKQLAKALHVSAAYLMCLSNEKILGEGAPNSSNLIPLLNLEQALNPSHHVQVIKEPLNITSSNFIGLSNELAKLSDKAFAFKMQDESMFPEFKTHDILIIDPDIPPSPGSYVAVKLDEDDIIIRRYKQLSTTKMQDYELIPLNENWPKISSQSPLEKFIIGQVCGILRFLKNY